MTGPGDTDAAAPVAERPAAAASLALERRDGGLVVRLGGRLDAYGLAPIWDRALAALDGAEGPVVVDASAVEYCDGAGLALLWRLRHRGEALGLELRIEGLADRFAGLLERFADADLAPQAPERRGSSLVAGLGRGFAALGHEAGEHVTFLGRVTAAFPGTLAGRHHLRWREAFRIAEQVGVDAFPLVAMISFLVGAVISLKAAHSLMKFGALMEMASFNITAMSTELAPLLTTIIVVGRSTSAFAAELGAMRVNEEIDALIVMGIDPVPYLVINRILASLGAVPLLTIFFGVFGLLGGLAIWLSFGYSPEAYLHQIQQNLHLSDVLGSLIKALTYGFLAPLLGCFYGLRPGLGRSARGVAAAATRAVVAGMVVISVTDALFAALFYFLKV